MQDDYKKLLKRTKKVLVRLKTKINPRAEVLINKVRFDYYGFVVMFNNERHKVYYFPSDKSYVYHNMVFKRRDDLTRMINSYIEGTPIIYSIVEYDGVKYMDTVQQYNGEKP